MVDMRTLDGCKDTTFEARAMFEVVAKVLDMRTLELEEVAEMLDTRMRDIARRILDVEERKLEMGTRRRENTVDGFNDVASRIRKLDAQGMTIDFDARSRLASRRTLVDNEV
jgi:uncharacterized protein YicC (UPF0701 family)